MKLSMKKIVHDVFVVDGGYFSSCVIFAPFDQKTHFCTPCVISVSATPPTATSAPPADASAPSATAPPPAAGAPQQPQQPYPGETDTIIFLSVITEFQSYSHLIF